MLTDLESFILDLIRDREGMRVCPVLSTFVGAFHISTVVIDPQGKMLDPFISRLVNTKSTSDVEIRRAFMSMDWLARVCLPTWLRLVPRFEHHASIIEETPEIKNLDTLDGAREVIVPVAEELRLEETTIGDTLFHVASDAVKHCGGYAANVAPWGTIHGIMEADEERYAKWLKTASLEKNASIHAALIAVNSVSDPGDKPDELDTVNTPAYSTLRPTVTTLQGSVCKLIEKMIECK